MNFTTKQLEILKVIYTANPDKTQVDLDQLLERLSYQPSKASIQFSIRALVGKGLIKRVGTEKRRGSRRVLFAMEPLGLHFTAHTRTAAYILSEEEDALLSAIGREFK